MPSWKPRKPAIASTGELRTLLWHLRQGGVDQARKHLRRRGLPGGTSAAVSGDGRSVSFAPTEWPQQWTRPFGDVTVATILDDFSSRAFGYEWDQVELSRTGWREQLEQHRTIRLEGDTPWT